MGLQVAFAWSSESEQEMLAMGFKKQEVYIKQAPSGFPAPDGKTISDHEKALGDREFFGMSRPPFQFVTTSYWGAGN